MPLSPARLSRTTRSILTIWLRCTRTNRRGVEARFDVADRQRAEQLGGAVEDRRCSGHWRAPPRRLDRDVMGGAVALHRQMAREPARRRRRRRRADHSEPRPNSAARRACRRPRSGRSEAARQRRGLRPVLGACGPAPEQQEHARHAERHDRDHDRQQIGRQRGRAIEACARVREHRQPRHRGVVHAGDRHAERGRRRISGGRPPPAARKPERQPGRARSRPPCSPPTKAERVLHVRARMQRRHADVVHRHDAAAHQAGGGAGARAVGGPALTANTAAPTTMTQTRNDSSVGSTR